MELAQKIGISYQRLSAILNFRWNPYTKVRRSKATERKLESFFRVPIEIIYPDLGEDISDRLSKKHVSFREFEHVPIDHAANVAYLPYEPDREDIIRDLEEGMECLTPRERIVIQARYGDTRKTHEELCRELSRTKQTIHNIEKKAIHKLRRFLDGRSLREAIAERKRQAKGS